MIQPETVSRPVRLAASILNTTETEMGDLFSRKRILVRLEEDLAESSDARETLCLAVNQCLRFCPSVGVSIPGSDGELLNECRRIAEGIHGPGHNLGIVASDDFSGFDAVLNIGTTVRKDMPWVTVNSGGWIARVATKDSLADALFWEETLQNPVGALAAACIGVGCIFFQILDRPVAVAAEFSLFSHLTGRPGVLTSEPSLPTSPLSLRTFLIGCGAVTNGWAYTIRRLPVTGKVWAIDRQSLSLENFGSYVAAERRWLAKPKVDLIRALLAPDIHVVASADEWEFFKIHLMYGLETPQMVVNGLDNVETRHSVQRLWPETIIDMAAGGLTSQVVVSQPVAGGLCLLGAFTRPTGEVGWAERLSKETGLRIDRILNGATTPITEEDVESAEPEKRENLDHARGKLICGHVTQHNLQMEGFDPDFAPAVPFVTCWSGIVGAAETLKWLMGFRHSLSLHYQKNFQSVRSRTLQMSCDPTCECRRQIPLNAA